MSHTASVDTLTTEVKDNLRHLVADTEQLLKTAAKNGDAQLDQLHDRLNGQLRRLRAQLGDLEEGTVARARAAARQADRTVRNHPYGTIGVAVAAGLLIGLLATRR
ncbi:MAG TPA: DUF883 family protein [Burkholderiaceae bacterium]|nr:DUF883 family protein [Burkholderiaceae bacterium]